MIKKILKNSIFFNPDQNRVRWVITEINSDQHHVELCQTEKKDRPNFILYALQES